MQQFGLENIKLRENKYCHLYIRQVTKKKERKKKSPRRVSGEESTRYGVAKSVISPAELGYMDTGAAG